MTHFQKELKAWRTVQDFARALNEAADSRPCPMAGIPLMWGILDHSQCSGFDHEAKIYPQSIAAVVGVDVPTNCSGCACYIKHMARIYTNRPKPKKAA